MTWSSFCNFSQFHTSYNLQTPSTPTFLSLNFLFSVFMVRTLIRGFRASLGILSMSHERRECENHVPFYSSSSHARLDYCSSKTKGGKNTEKKLLYRLMISFTNFFSKPFFPFLFFSSNFMPIAFRWISAHSSDPPHVIVCNWNIVLRVILTCCYCLKQPKEGLKKASLNGGEK